MITLNEKFCLKVYLGSCSNSHPTWATSLLDFPYSPSFSSSPIFLSTLQIAFSHNVPTQDAFSTSLSFRVTKIKTMRLWMVVCFGLSIARQWEGTWRMRTSILVYEIRIFLMENKHEETSYLCHIDMYCSCVRLSSSTLN